MNRRQFLRNAVVGGSLVWAGVPVQARSRKQRPNILWIQTDEQRPDSLGCYDQPWAKTPHIDALAKRGTVFHKAMVQCPQCVPCRNSQLTARYPQEIMCTFNQAGIGFPEDTVSFVDVFNEAGYHTVTFGKQHTSAPIAWQVEKDWVNNPKYAGYYKLNKNYQHEDYGVVNRPSTQGPIIRAGIYPGGDDNPSRNITDWAMDYLEQNGGKKPFLLRVSHNFPHTPVLVSKPWDQTYQPEEIPIRSVDQKARLGRSAWDQLSSGYQNMDKIPADDYQRCWQHYMGLCAQVDNEVGRLLGKLDELGLRENTIIMYSSDHGACLGQFGIATKGTFDDPSWRVPFIWSWPGHIPEGKHDRHVCELIDTGKTLLNLCGLQDKTPANWRGRDLFKDPAPEAVFGQIGFPNVNSPIAQKSKERRETFIQMRVGVRTERYRLDVSYMRDGKRLPNDNGNLFDMEKDPEELVNLWENPAYRAIKEHHLKLIDDWFERIDQPAALFKDA